MIYVSTKDIMETKFKAGETVYLVSNSHFIEEANVVMTISGKRQIADAMQGHFQNGNLPKHWREEGYQRQMV